MTIAALVLASCAAESPRGTVEAYARAMAKGDAHGAWELLDAPTRAVVSEAELARSATAAAALADDVREGVRLERAEVALASGRTVHLVREEGAWKIAGGVVAEPRGTPESALRAFFEAAAAGDLARVRRLIPEAHAAAFQDDATLAAHLAALRDRIDAARGGALAKPADIEGTRARVAYAPGRVARLVHEASGWKLVDLE